MAKGSFGHRMAALKNARHERYAQELALGKTSDEAYQAAGYKPNRGNACRLKANERVAQRIADIKEAAAERGDHTLDTILAELKEDRALAHSVSQAGAAVSATMGKAKLLGLIKDKMEHTGKDGEGIEVAVWTPLDRAKALAALMAKQRG